MQKSLTLFFDFDGTLVDTKERSWRVYRDILSRDDHSFLARDTYWERKRMHVPTEEILKETHAEGSFRAYMSEYEKRIEHPDYVFYDNLFENIKNILKELRSSHTLYLVTLRKDRKLLGQQLRDMRIASYFKKVLTPATTVEPRWKMKQILIENYLRDSCSSVLIGDTEIDVLAARNAGIISVAVCAGIRTRELLRKTQPDFLIDDMNELVPLLAKI